MTGRAIKWTKQIISQRHICIFFQFGLHVYFGSVQLLNSGCDFFFSFFSPPQWLLTVTLNVSTGNWSMNGFSPIPLANLGACEFVFMYVFIRVRSSLRDWVRQSLLSQKTHFNKNLLTLTFNSWWQWRSFHSSHCEPHSFLHYSVKSQHFEFGLKMHPLVFAPFWLLTVALTSVYTIKRECVER